MEMFWASLPKVLLLISILEFTKFEMKFVND